MQPKFLSVFAVAGLLACLNSSLASNWPHWRGPHDNGTAEAGDYPVHWNEGSNLLWKTALPGKGCSTPIVWDGKIFVTAPADGEDAVLAFDWSGKLLWQTKLGAENPGRHRNGSGSNPSPTTDGSSVFVAFKSGTFAALSFDGQVRWSTNLVQAYGPVNLNWDAGISPVLTEKSVVMARMHHGESWLAAFDKSTGALQWKVPRNYTTPGENDHGYTTPLVLRQHGREALLLWGGEHLTAYDAADGALLWSCAGFNPKGGRNWPAVATPVVAGDVAVVAYGRNDRGIPLLYGVRLDGNGDVTDTHQVWKRSDIGTFVPSPALYRGRAYLVRDRGEVECLDPGSGKTLWSDAFPKTSSNYYGSPVIADGKLFAVREDGVVFVAKVGDAFELLAENPMGERVIASPVLVDGRILIRGEETLFCFGRAEL